MATINYKTKQKLPVQHAVLKALEWIGVRQTSYAEIARVSSKYSSDCRYAILDLIEKGYIKRIQVKGYANATRGNRYAYEITEAGTAWANKELTEEEVSQEIIGLFKESEK